MNCRNFVLLGFIFLGGSCTVFAATGDSYLIVDHNAVLEFEQIPDYWLEQAKELTMHYVRRSHGSQIIAGMNILRNMDPVKYAAAWGDGLTCDIFYPYGDPPTLPVGDGLLIRSQDLLYDQYWSTPEGIANTELFAASGLFDYSMFSWCGEMTGQDDPFRDEYLAVMDSFEQAYPNMRFIYMTGHTDNRDGEWNWLDENNDVIRAYCIANNKILYDFADIESWDPNGNYYPDAHDDCPWCGDWCNNNPQDCQDLPEMAGGSSCTECAHSHGLNCLMKGQAFWWMMARLAGWEGTTGGTGSGVYYVDGEDGSDADDGLSWVSAKATLQAAIDAAEADNEIWVKAGTYAISSQIQVNKALGIYGGFAGDESERSQRDWAGNITTIDGQDTVGILKVTDEPIIDGFTLTNGYNTDDLRGGAVYIAGWYKSPTISNCIISGNTAYVNPLGPEGYNGGGAIYVGIGTPIFTNCLITNNTTNAYGGAVNLYSGSPEFINCTISINTALEGGGLYLQGDNTVLEAQFYNCIVWGNTGASDANDVKVKLDGDEPLGSNNCSSVQIGTGTILADPLFIDPDSDDFHLRYDSPCIDVGDSNSVPADVADLDGDGDIDESIPSDIDGRPRFIDDPNSANTGSGPPPIVDIGVYEFDEISCGDADHPYPVGDINRDCAVDTLDMVAMVRAWLAEPNSPGWNALCDIAPEGGDGVIDSQDFAVFAAQWQVGVPSVKAGVSLDNQWMYQNLPGSTNSNLTASEVVTYDPLNNSDYVYSWEFVLPEDVNVPPSTIDGGGSIDTYWVFAAPGCDEPGGLSDSGSPFRLKVTVTGLEHGNTGTAETQFGIALLGDVNNDTFVNGPDRGIINTFLENGSAGEFTLRDCDLTCDGLVNVSDRGILNTIWQGFLGQNSVTSPCPFR